MYVNDKIKTPQKAAFGARDKAKYRIFAGSLKVVNFRLKFGKLNAKIKMGKAKIIKYIQGLCFFL